VGYDHAHEFVPVFACSYFEDDFIMPVAMIDSGDSNFQDEAGPASVRNYQVASTSEDEQRQISHSREFDRFGYFSNARCFDEVASWSPNLKSGERGQRNVFGDDHGRILSIYTNEKEVFGFGVTLDWLASQLDGRGVLALLLRY
jgi:hypothetical protein